MGGSAFSKGSGVGGAGGGWPLCSAPHGCTRLLPATGRGPGSQERSLLHAKAASGAKRDASLSEVLTLTFHVSAHPLSPFHNCTREVLLPKGAPTSETPDLRLQAPRPGSPPPSGSVPSTRRGTEDQEWRLRAFSPPYAISPTRRDTKAALLPFSASA